MIKDIPSPMTCSTLKICALIERYQPEEEVERPLPFLSELEYLIDAQLKDDANDDLLVTRIASPAMYQEEANREMDEIEGKHGIPLYDRSIEDVSHETYGYAFTQNLCALAKNGMTRIQAAKETFSRVITEKLQEEYELNDQDIVFPESYNETIKQAMERPYSELIYRIEMGNKKLRTCLQRIERIMWLQAGIGQEEALRLKRAHYKAKTKAMAIERGKLNFSLAWGNSLTNRTFYKVRSVPDNKRCLNEISGCPLRCKLGKDGYC